MTQKASDEVIKQLAIDTDKFFAEQVVKYKDEMHPLEASAIFLSRIILMNRSLNTEEAFKRLGTAALNIQEPAPLVKEEQDGRVD